MPKQTIQLKRVYDKPEKKDGLRILVDKLWPRGLSKEAAKIDLWIKEIAPSNNLRKWFKHDPKKWAQFQTRYAEELRDEKEAINRLKEAIDKEPIITLLFAASDTEHNNAVALRKILKL
ncbi:MAG: DUF488 domain-containing protein [Candidatus Pacebacteria bacterium]|nr:DUF488 domain-containing protein [Candidatus Paceibacterota bacterium]